MLCRNPCVGPLVWPPLPSGAAGCEGGVGVRGWRGRSHPLVWFSYAMPYLIRGVHRRVCSSPLGPSRPRVSWNPRRVVDGRPRTVARPTRSHRPGWGIRRPGSLDTRSHMTPSTERFIGIDVSQEALDAHVRPDDSARRFANTTEGIAALLTWLQSLGPALIVLEASGGYENEVLTTLSLGGLPVCLINPKRVRDFAKARGRLAKTDAIDAAVLADFAQTFRPP